MMKLIVASLNFANAPEIISSDYSRVVSVAWVLIKSVTSPVYSTLSCYEMYYRASNVAQLPYKTKKFFVNLATIRFQNTPKLHRDELGVCILV